MVNVPRGAHQAREVTSSTANLSADQKRSSQSFSSDVEGSLASSGCSSDDENALPLDAYDGSTESGDLASQQKFSYMNTFNKVVSASKKKSRKVLEKMAATTVVNHASQPKDEAETIRKFEARVRELETMNATLEREVATLRDSNHALQKENEELKRSQKMVASGGDPDEYPDDVSPPASPPAKQESMFDNPLFQHMANMNLQSTNGSHW